MAVKDIRVLKPAPNEFLLDAIRADGSNEYQLRIPEATKAGVQATQKALQSWRPSMNEFQDALVNRIGLQLIKNSSWTNPYAEFKVGQLTGGDTIEEINIGLVMAKAYDTDREEMEKALFGTHRSEVQSNFHKVNRRDVYEITINNMLLNNAFDTPMGLSNFTTKLMESVSTSDAWDEFLIMCQLFPEYESNGGYFKVKIPEVSDIESDEAAAKGALRRLRETADNLTFISRRYNAAKMPIHAKREELIIFCTPAFNAAVDVEALAGAFNVDKAKMHGRIIVIPEEQFAIEGCEAVMTTKEFFVVADQVFETASQYNPRALQNNYFLHHHQVISSSRFVPAVMFTTKTGDAIPKLITPVTSVSAITVENREGTVPATVERGEIYSLYATAVTTPAGGVNDGVRWTVAGATSPRTYVTTSGVLHVGGDEGAATLTVTATATWLDPAGLMKNGATSTKVLTVSGLAVPVWPLNGSVSETVTGITVEGVAVSPAFAAGTYAYTVIVPGGTTTLDEITVTGPDEGDVVITLNAANDVFTVSAPSAPGDPVYTVTVN